MSIVVAVVRAGRTEREIRCKERLTPQQLNLLYMLSEHVGRPISIDDLCHRLKIGYITLRFHVCRLRQKLMDDWTVGSVVHKGYRLMYIGGSLLEADTTRIDILPDAISERHHTPEHRAKIKESVERYYKRPSSRRAKIYPGGDRMMIS